ncbi:S10 family serine carboxypeptidase-like protein [Shewanella sp.]|uniref:S10 family serine carboxypeptidase-like protein n=1 Tax=Shewanella sp. TaxID=50422 RepID=UPI003A97C3CD
MSSLRFLSCLARPVALTVAAFSLLCMSAVAQDDQAMWSSHCGESHSFKNVSYRGCLETLALESGEHGTTMDAISYTVKSTTSRPVMFLFNGGPGSSSSMLHFDGLGPKQKQKGADGKDAFVDNPHSLLDQVDLVFIDPPGSGLTQAPESEASRLKFWTSEGDAKAFVQFVRRWLAEHHRSDARIFIGGESYGGYRLALMSKQLTDLNVGGLLFISPLLDGSDTSEADGNVLSYVFNLPSMAIAAAHYHRGNLQDKSLQQIYQQVSQYSYQVYTPALMQGAALAKNTQQKIAQELAAMLGISAKDLLDKSLKLGVEDYRNMLLASDGNVFGRLDSRVEAPLPPPRKDKVSALDDPALGLKGGLEIKVPLYTHYLQQLTGISNDAPYKALNLNINFHWQYAPHREGFEGEAFYFNPTANLADFVKQKPDSKLLVLSGYYDLAIPTQAVEFALNQADIPQQNLTLAILQTGHSVFADKAARPELDKLLKEFIK